MTEPLTVTLYFLGGLNDCIVAKGLQQIPREARYIGSSKMYDIYDSGSQFYAVEKITKWNK